MANTWDGEKDNEPSLMRDWAHTERVAATDPVVVQLMPDIGAEFAAEDAAQESAKERIFSRGRTLLKAKHQLNVRG